MLLINNHLNNQTLRNANFSLSEKLLRISLWIWFKKRVALQKHHALMEVTHAQVCWRIPLHCVVLWFSKKVCELDWAVTLTQKNSACFFAKMLFSLTPLLCCTLTTLQCQRKTHFCIQLSDTYWYIHCNIENAGKEHVNSAKITRGFCGTKNESFSVEYFNLFQCLGYLTTLLNGIKDQ